MKQSTPRHWPRLPQRVIGLAATGGIVLFVVGTPVVLLAIGAGPTLNPDWNGLRTMLTSPDDGTLALKVLALVAWLAWLVMTGSLVVETIARLRGAHTPRLPALGLPQRAAGHLVATASLLFIALPVVTQAVAPPPAHAAEFPRTLVPEQRDTTVATAAAPESRVATTTAITPEKKLSTFDYTVKRGDSLWKIAHDQLGDGKQYVEIVDLNEGVLNGKADFITPGTVLRLPHEETVQSRAPGTEETYTVEPGETLSEIALNELGDPARYPEILEASHDTVQPDSARLRDPNLIRPGWKLSIPDKAPHGRSEAVPPDPSPNPSEDITPPVEPTPTPARSGEPSITPSVEPAPESNGHAEAAAPAVVNDPDEVAPGWLLPGLAGAGAVLAGALLLAVRSHRRTQLRFRRPGHIIVPPPPELRAVEKTVHVVGAAMVAPVERLDALLRYLAASVAEPPTVVSVELAPDAVILHLIDDADLPAPWEGAGTTWSVSLDTDVPEQSDQLPPYPLLVTVGRDGADHLWLLNLEHLGVVTVTGDPDNVEAFGRYVAAELVLNPWSVLVCVDTLGLAAELTTLDSLRLHHHGENDLGFLDQLARDLAPDTGLPHLDPDLFHAVISVNGVREAPRVRKIVKLITSYPGRPGATVVAIGGTPEAGDVIVEVTTAGRLVADSLGLDVVAVGLTTDEAAACAAIVDITRDANNTPMPVDDTGPEAWRGFTDTAGALREEYVEARPAGPGGEESLLPLAAVQYADVAATTVEDIETLAPLGSPNIRCSVEDADPTLDDDLALWFDTSCPLPKLVLLGSVSARAHGDVSGVAKRKPFYVELFAYLALHPHGATSSEVADAMSITTNRAYVDLNMLRSWLGANPRTGTDHLPSAKLSRVAAERGTPAYQLDDVLTDLDLFRRLRARAQARGSEGIADLETALGLVTGPPFSQLRPVGWSWLLEGERLDHVMGCAVVDVAHILTTHALTVGDLTLARFSAETACHAAPYDEISRLDLVQVAAVTGHADLAERHLIDGIFNRSDDDLGPVDLPPRTAQVVRQRGWDQRSSHQ